jgi:poly(3-hydroxybutyrate) depolymerase
MLIAAPVDPMANPTRVSRLLRAHPLSWYERNIIGEVAAASVGRGRLVYPGSLQLLGLWAYLARHISEGGELLFKLLDDDGVDSVRFPFLDLYSAVMDLPAEVFLDIVRHVYQEQTLVRRKLPVGNGGPSLRAIRATALMTVEGECDDVAAPGQTGSAHDLCSSVPADAKLRLIVPGCGHFCLFHGRTWRTQVLPAVRGFIERFDQPQARHGA